MGPGANGGRFGRMGALFIVSPSQPQEKFMQGSAARPWGDCDTTPKLL